jgi:hypothetical protein
MSSDIKGIHDHGAIHEEKAYPWSTREEKNLHLGMCSVSISLWRRTSKFITEPNRPISNYKPHQVSIFRQWCLQSGGNYFTRQCILDIEELDEI